MTMVGIAFSALLATSDSTVGSMEDTVCSHCPSTNSIEFPPTRPKLEMPGSMVTEDVRLCKSTIKGSVGLETPRTYVGVLLAAAWEVTVRADRIGRTTSNTSSVLL